MKAALFRKTHEPLTIERVEIDKPWAGEVLVRIDATGVCHSDLHPARGEWPARTPLVLGHEGVGVVEAVGGGVHGITPGQRVLLHLAPGCGSCRHCDVGRPILCQEQVEAMGRAGLTTGPSPIDGDGGEIGAYSLLACFAERAVVAARSVIPLPDGVPADVAALVGCAVITGLGAAIQTLDIPAGSRGAVIGAGGVGVNAIQGARVRGAADIVAVDPAAGRREQSARFGATAALDPAQAAELIASAPRDGFDWTIVTVGRPEAMKLGVELLRPGGTACMVGLAPQGQPVGIDMLDLVTYERRIVGSAYGSLTPRQLVPRILRLYLEGRILLDELVSERVPLHEINAAFDHSRRAEGLRPVLLPGGAAAW